VLSFTLNTGGRVVQARIVRGSRHAALDSATLAMAQEAPPFPAIPAELARSRMTFKVPIQFKIE
jgi:periplasmic protein TonB